MKATQDAAARLEQNLHLLPVFLAEDVRAVLKAADDAVESAQVVIRVIPDEYIPVRFLERWQKALGAWALTRGPQNTASVALPEGRE